MQDLIPISLMLLKFKLPVPSEMALARCPACRQVDATLHEGVRVHFANEVTGVWNYGTVRVDPLGPVLESLAEAAGAR